MNTPVRKIWHLDAAFLGPYRGVPKKSLTH
jgi:hypothetical protein